MWFLLVVIAVCDAGLMPAYLGELMSKIIYLIL